MATYIVKPGDTLQNLIKSLGVGIADLYTLNPWLNDYATMPDNIALPSGAPVKTEKGVQYSSATEGLINKDVEGAMQYLVGQGMPQADAATLERILPELSRQWEGINAKLIADTEYRGLAGVKAPSLTPLDFLTNLKNSGTLDAMMNNPTFTGQFNQAPALSSRRIRF